MKKNLRFNLQEAAGAVGDYGTILPIVLSAAAISGMNLSHILFFFAIFYIATGLYYRIPIPVEPMKAIGVVVIAGTLKGAQITGAGISMGLILLLIGLTGSMEFIKKYIPVPIIHGLQLALALTLMKQAVKFVVGDWVLGLISLAVILIFTFAPLLDISALVVLALGIAVGIYYNGVPEIALFSLPRLIVPSGADLWSGFLYGTVAQLPLTLGNAALATSLLAKDLLNKEVPEKKLVTTMGVMCLVSTSFGGFPMCHGAGGLAAQYRFGARTGGANIISGAFFLVLALFFGASNLANLIPFGVLGALLLFSGLELARGAIKTTSYFFTGATGILGFLIGITPAFAIMLALYWLYDFWQKRFPRQNNQQE